MPALLVIELASDWPFEAPQGATVVSARDYLTDPEAFGTRATTVFNLCRSYRYQSVGYYVSLLAAARGQRPLPDVGTIQGLRRRAWLRSLPDELDERIERALGPLRSDAFDLSIYFGRSLAKRYDRIARELFNLFPSPLLRAGFRRTEGRFEIRSLRAIAAREVPESHREFVVEAAQRHFEGRSRRARRRPYDLAILVDPNEAEPPSDAKAIGRFVRAARSCGFEVECIEPDDLGRVGEFDALFLRETTRVDHHTFAFASRGEADGLVVIDDTTSILRATNKVFLAEALARARVPSPKTRIVHEDSIDAVGSELGFPCILKLPDSAFSMGVVRCDDSDAFRDRAREYFERSELLVAQEFFPTEFDWRIGVLDRQPLYAGRYYLARSHWQIIRRDDGGKVTRYGKSDCVPIEDVPAPVLRSSLRAASLIGDGLYGVDLKERRGRGYVIEVNDNPSIDAGFEDRRLGTELYRRIMAVFRKRVDRRKHGVEPPR